MSFIPEKAMPHVTVKPGELTEDGKIVRIGGDAPAETSASYGWVLGAVGAGVAVAAGAAALFSLRRSTPKTPVRRRAVRKPATTKPSATATKPATRRRTTKKAATAAA